MTSPPAAPCNNVVGTTATCSGNVAGGISTSAPYTVLNVNNLTANITPASGVDGIAFTSTGDITIDSSTGAFAVATTGNNAEAITAQTTTGAISVTSQGNLTTTGNNSEAIWAQATSSGAVTVDLTGNNNDCGQRCRGHQRPIGRRTGDRHLRG